MVPRGPRGIQLVTLWPKGDATGGLMAWGIQLVAKEPLGKQLVVCVIIGIPFIDWRPLDTT